MIRQRTISVTLTDQSGDVMTLQGRLEDPFHDILISLAIDRPTLKIVSASGGMGRIPYAEGCPQSLPGLAALAGVQIADGLSRRLREVTGGSMGCPYLAEIAEQVCRFALVLIKSDEARDAVARGDRERFRALRRQMGVCAGHTLAGEDDLPQWLSDERP